MKDFMVKTIDALELPQTFLLAAHSFGGFLASLYACERPERVESLFLLSPVGTETYDPSDYEPMAYSEQMEPNKLTNPSWINYSANLQKTKSHPFAQVYAMP